MADNIQVAIRVRQLIDKEKLAGLKSNWMVDGNSLYCSEDSQTGKKPTVYTFDHIFDETAVTLDIFSDICQPILQASLNGFNGTIFAYGQSSSGKTHTITGSQLHPGIIPLAVDEIFNQIEQIPHKEFLIRMSYLELYNEKLSDLLSDDDASLKLQEDTEKNIRVIGAAEEVIKQRSMVPTVLKKGNAKRHTAATKQNDRSSRSHCILRFVIESRVIGEEDSAVNVSNLYFVDLAGSEKASDNSGDRLREGCSINKSLFTLGNVIRKLSGDDNFQHVSNRDSKLTRLLQNSLGGNSKTAIICTITPAHIEESESTLKFASRAKTIQNEAHVNECLSDAALLTRYRKKIKSLEKQIREGGDDEMAKKLQEKEDTIENLKKMILISGSGHSDEPVSKKRRRETWAPGKRNGKSRLSLPHVGNFIRAPLNIEEPIVEEEEEPPQLPQPVVHTEVRTSDVGLTEIKMDDIMFPEFVEDRASQQNNETLQMMDVKMLFELQDLNNELQEELAKKSNRMESLGEYKDLELQMKDETIKELTEKINDHEQGMRWLEDEYMKAKQERNTYKQKLESLNRQLKSVEDGTGLSVKCEQLADTEKKVENLNSEIEIQKSRYEFHIEQMKKKMENLTNMLEEKGVDLDVIKQRMSSQTETNDEMTELKSAHKAKIVELQDEIDMLMLKVEREQNKCKELSESYDISLEDQRNRLQKVIEDRDEEIAAYRGLLVEETAKNSESKSTVVNESEKDRLKKDDKDLEEIIKKLQDEVEMYKKMFEEQKDESKKESESANLQTELLRAELDSIRSTHEEEISQWRQKYKQLLEDRSSTSYSGLPDEQREMIFAELDSLKAMYEEEMNSLKEENERLRKRLVEYKHKSQVTPPQADSDSVTEMRKSYEKQVEEFKLHLDEKDKIIQSYVDKPVNNGDMTMVTAEQVESIKTEYEEKLKAQRELHGQQIDTKVDEMKKMYEERIQEITETYEQQLKQCPQTPTESASLEAEILKAEMEEMRLQYEMKLTQGENTEGVALQTELLKVDMTELKAKYEREIEEMKEQHAADLAESKQRLETSPACNVDSEAFIEEMTSMKSSYEETIQKYEIQISELKDKITELSDKLSEGIDKDNMLCEVSESVSNNEKSSEESEGAVKASYDSEMTKHKERISQLEEEISQLKTISEADVASLNRENRIEQIQNEMREMKESYETKLAELQKYETWYQEHSHKLEQLADNDVKSLQDEMFEVENSEPVPGIEMKSLQDELDEVNKDKPELASEMKSLQDELLEATHSCGHDSENEMKSLQEELLEAKNSCESGTEDEVKSLQDELLEANNNCEQESENDTKSLQDELLEVEAKRMGRKQRQRVVSFTDEENGVVKTEKVIKRVKFDDTITDIDMNNSCRSLDCCKEKEEMCSMYETTINEAQEELSLFRETVNKLQVEMEELHGRIKSLKAEKLELINAKADLEELQVKKEELHGRIKSLKTEKLELINAKADLEEKLDLNSKSLSEVRESHEKERDLIENRNTELQQKIDKLETDMGLQVELIAAYETQIEEMKEKLKTEKQNSGDMVCKDDVDERLSSLSSELEGVVSGKTRLETEIKNLTEEKKKEVESLTEQLSKYAESYVSQEEVEERMKTEREKLEVKDSENCELKNRIVKMEEETMLRQELISTYELELEELREKLDAAKEGLKALDGKEEMQRLEADFTERLGNVQTEKDQLEVEMNRLREEKESEILSLKHELENVTDNRLHAEELEKRLTTVQTEKENLVEEMNKLKEEKEIEIQVLTEEIEKMSNSYTSTEEINKLIEEKDIEIQNFKEELEKIVDCSVTIEELNQLREEKEIEIQGLKQEIEKISENSTRTEELDQLREEKENEIQGLKQELEKISESSASSEEINQLREEKDVEIQGLKQELERILESYISTEEFEKRISELQNEKDELQEKLNTQEDKQQSVEFYEELIDELKQSIKEEEKISAELQTKCDELEAELKCEKENKLGDEDLHQKLDRLTCENTLNAELIEEYKLEISEMKEKMSNEEKSKNKKVEDLDNYYSEEIVTLRTEKENIELALKENSSKYESEILELQRHVEKISNEKEQMKKLGYEKIDELKREKCELDEVIKGYKAEIKTLKEQLDGEMNARERTESDCKRIDILEREKQELSELVSAYKQEIQELKAEVVDSKNKVDKEREELVEKEKQHQSEKIQSLEMEIETLKSKITSLEQDNDLLTLSLPPDTVKYHSKPENVDWENKWEEFVKLEKRKRYVMGFEIRELKSKVKRLEEYVKTDAEDAMKILQMTDKIKRLETKIATLEEEKQNNSKTAGFISDDEHSCKYRQDLLKMKTENFDIQQKLDAKKKDIDEMHEKHQNQISRLKNELRRRDDLEKTFEVGKLLQPAFTDEKSKELPAKTSDMWNGSSTAGGIVDHFKVCLLDSENKRLKKDLEKANKELILLKGRKESVSSKENISENNLSKTDKKETEDPELIPISSSTQRHVLAEMTAKAPTPSKPTCEQPLPSSSKKKEDSCKFDISDLFQKKEEPNFYKPSSKRKKVFENEDPDKCKTS